MSKPDLDDLDGLIRGSYDQLAGRYAEVFFHELDRKPFDRRWLDRFADSVGRGKQACDIGCGPGHIAAYLAARGLVMSGVDVSAAMVHQARALSEGIAFDVGDMRSLDRADASLDGVVAFYSIIHLTRADAPGALAELTRVLRPGGQLLISFHAGDGDIHVDEMLDLPVPMYATLYGLDEMIGYARDAGLAIVEATTRPPYEHEYPTERAYLAARKI